MTQGGYLLKFRNARMGSLSLGGPQGQLCRIFDDLDIE